MAPFFYLPIPEILRFHDTYAAFPNFFDSQIICCRNQNRFGTPEIRRYLNNNYDHASFRPKDIQNLYKNQIIVINSHLSNTSGNWF